ncbi:MAG: tape measure protein, partial [Desulfuromonadaceae bacterium]|nr:tape measure protein [Desulfuromonadaceae bacterium]
GMRLTGVLGGIGLVALTKELLDTGLQLEKLTRLFVAATGSASLAAREMEYIRQLSEKMGLSFLTTAESYGKFLAATRNTSLEGEKGRKVFEGVTTATVALGLSADDTSGIFNALQQMISKGKVQAEELRGQLGERLPGAFKMAADAMGVTTAKLDKMLQNGQVVAGDLLPKLAAELERTFSGAAVDGAKSAQAELNRFNNAIYDLKSSTGAALIPALTEITKGLTGLVRDGIQPVVSGAISVQAEFIRLGMVVDKAGGSLTSFNYAFYKTAEIATRFVTLGQFGDSLKNAAENADKYNKMYEQRYSDKDSRLQQLAETEQRLLNSMSLKGSDYTSAELLAQQANARAGGSASSKVAKGAKPVDLLLEQIKTYQRDREKINTILIAESSALESGGAFSAAAFNTELSTGSRYKKSGSLSLLGSGINTVRQDPISNDDLITINASQSQWVAKQTEMQQQALESKRSFNVEMAAMRGDYLQQELFDLDNQQADMERRWAMNTDSFAEYESRKTQIQTMFDQKRGAASINNEQRLAQTKLQTNQNYMNAFGSVLQAINTLAGDKYKILFLLTQGAALATTFSATQAASASALAPPPLGLGPVAGAPLAASIEIAGYAAMGAIAATTVAGMVGGRGGNVSGISAGSFSSPGSDFVTQPLAPTQQSPSINVTMNFDGTTLVDEQKLTRWSEDVLIPSLRELKTRGVTA